MAVLPLGIVQHSRPLELCLDAATELAPALARRVLARAGLALLQDAARTRDPERLKRLLDTQRVLHRLQHELAAASGTALAHLMVACRPPAGGVQGRLDGHWRHAEEQVDETLAVERIAASLHDAVADRRQALEQALNGGRAGAVAAGADPLGPPTWLRALRGAMSQCGVEAATRTLLLDYCGQQLGSELAALYTRLCGLLRARGVTSPVVRPVGVPVTRCGSGPAEREPAATPTGLRHLDGWFLGHGRAAAQPRTPPVAQAASFGSAADRLALRERVADLLVSTLAADERLLPAAARLVHGLRPHLLAAARPGDDFFLDPGHPWRQVLAAFTRRAMMRPPTHRSGGSRFVQPLAACVEQIGRLAPGSAAAAAHALAALQRPEGRWHDEAKCRRAASALGRAETRNVVARGLAAELGLRPEFAGAPAVLKRFLAGPWAQAMAAAVLLDIGEADPGNHGRTASDLLWSAQPGAVAQSPARLASILPRMVANLRRGLRSIEHPEAETTAFLQWLGGLYRQALPPGASDPDLATLAPAGLEQPASEPAGASGSEPWLTAAEIRDAHLLDAAQLREQFPGVAIEGLDLAAATWRAAGGLDCGGIVEVRGRRGRERWAVEWASRHGVLFLFSDAAGRLRSLTAPVLASLMRAGAARIVCRQSLSDATVDSLAQVALHATLPEPGKRPGGMAQTPRRRTARAIGAAARSEQ
ncbi:MAG TPA: DUF1631 family protein [Ramlibacter sp.]